MVLPDFYASARITSTASSSYKMNQYLLGHGYWSYVEGANDEAPESTHGDYPAWEQSASRVLEYFASCVGEQLLSVRCAKMSKGAWENQKKVFTASTTGRKLQLRQRDLSMADYTSKIKEICDSLASIDVNIEESEMVQVCLGIWRQSSGRSERLCVPGRIRRPFSTYSRCSW